MGPVALFPNVQDNSWYFDPKLCKGADCVRHYQGCSSTGLETNTKVASIIPRNLTPEYLGESCDGQMHKLGKKPQNTRSEMQKGL